MVPDQLLKFCKERRIRTAPTRDQSYIGWLLTLENELLYGTEFASKNFKIFNKCGENYKEDYRRRPLLEWVERQIIDYKGE